MRIYDTRRLSAQLMMMTCFTGSQADYNHRRRLSDITLGATFPSHPIPISLVLFPVPLLSFSFFFLLTPKSINPWGLRIAVSFRNCYHDLVNWSFSNQWKGFWYIFRLKLCTTCSMTHLYFHCSVWMYKMAICIKIEPDAGMQKSAHSTVGENLQKSNAFRGGLACGRRAIASMEFCRVCD